MPIVMDEIFVVRLHRRRPNPEVPVEPRRRRLRRFEPDGIAPARKEEVRLIHVSDLARMDQFDRLSETAPPSSLCPSGSYPIVFAGGLNELRTFPNVVRNG